MPPVKERLEMPVATQKTDTGLTPGLLKVLNKQVSPQLASVFWKHGIMFRNPMKG